MPVEAILRMRAAADGRIPPFPGDHVRAGLLRAIETVDPDLSSFLHNFPRTKPYAIKPIIPERGKKDIVGDLWYVKMGLWVRASISVLVDSLIERFKRVLKRIRTVIIAGIPFEVEPDIAFRELKYNEMKEEAVKRFGIEFLTPVAFKGMDERFVTPFPEPARLFRSLSNIWAKFAGEMPTPPDGVVPVRYKLKTREVTVSGAKLVGCRGYVEYNILGDPNDAYKLLKLAEFSNVGYKRTAGLGVVKVRF